MLSIFLSPSLLSSFLAFLSPRLWSESSPAAGPEASGSSGATSPPTESESLSSAMVAACIFWERFDAICAAFNVRVSGLYGRRGLHAHCPPINRLENGASDRARASGLNALRSRRMRTHLAAAFACDSTLYATTTIVLRAGQSSRRPSAASSSRTVKKSAAGRMGPSFGCGVILFSSFRLSTLAGRFHPQSLRLDHLQPTDKSSWCVDLSCPLENWQSDLHFVLPSSPDSFRPTTLVDPLIIEHASLSSATELGPRRSGAPCPTSSPAASSPSTSSTRRRARSSRVRCCSSRPTFGIRLLTLHAFSIQQSLNTPMTRETLSVSADSHRCCRSAGR